MELNCRIRQSAAYQALTPHGVEYIERALIADPARFVGRGSLTSVSGGYASHRFPNLTEYESISCEKLFVLEAVLDDSVLDLRSQPPSILKVITSTAGRKRSVEATLDYLVFRQEVITLVECKRAAQLEELAQKSPDWMKEDDGHFTHGPGLEVARRFGIEFEVYCPDQLPAAYRANLQLLARLPREDLLTKYPGTLRLIQKRLASRPHTVLELCSEYQITGAWLYQAIQKGEIFGLLEHQHLGVDFMLYGTKSEADLRLSQLGRSVRVEELGPLHTRFLRASKKELDLAEAAQRRYDHRRAENLPMDSTDYRDANRLSLAQAEAAPRRAAFLRRVADRGGKGNPLPLRITQEVRKHAGGYFADGGLPTRTRMFADFQLHLELLGLPSPSRETYRQIVNRELGPEKVALLSGGKRAMHAVRARTDGANSNPSLQIGGLRVHLDGVYGDIKGKKKHEWLFLRPIFYPLVDNATGYVAGRGVKVGYSGSVASLMAYRNCYERHGFLPAQVVFDWGSEFVNNAIREASGFFGIGYEQRPPGAPRFGAMGEMFNAQLSSFLQSLSGGMYFDKLGRAADSKKKSVSNASMSIPQIVELTDHWMFEVWNKTPIGANSKTPEELWKESVSCFPEAVVHVQDSLLSKYFTSMPVGAKRICAARGIRYGGVNYASEQLATMLDRGERPTGPRLDCMDPSVIHVMTREGPHSLRSLEYQRCQGMADPQRLEALRDLYCARSTAESNQGARNMKEARMRREIDAARKREDAPREARSPESTASAKSLFSKISQTPIRPLDCIHTGRTYP